MRWAATVVPMNQMTDIYKIMFGKPQRKGQVGAVGVDWRIISKWILKT
jgi:hypothetical protein